MLSLPTKSPRAERWGEGGVKKSDFPKQFVSHYIPSLLEINWMPTFDMKWPAYKYIVRGQDTMYKIA
jgi:hypothetical protein